MCATVREQAEAKLQAHLKGDTSRTDGAANMEALAIKEQDLKFLQEENKSLAMQLEPEHEARVLDMTRAAKELAAAQEDLAAAQVR